MDETRAGTTSANQGLAAQHITLQAGIFSGHKAAVHGGAREGMQLSMRPWSTGRLRDDSRHNR
jgi:hypothetical protein